MILLLFVPDLFQEISLTKVIRRKKRSCWRHIWTHNVCDSFNHWTNFSDFYRFFVNSTSVIALLCFESLDDVHKASPPLFQMLDSVNCRKRHTQTPLATNNRMPTYYRYSSSYQRFLRYWFVMLLNVVQFKFVNLYDYSCLFTLCIYYGL